MPDDDAISRLEGERNAAIRLGDQHLNEMLTALAKLRKMRREIRRAIVLLRTGRSSDALVLLQALSREEK